MVFAAFNNFLHLSLINEGFINTNRENQKNSFVYLLNRMDKFSVFYLITLPHVSVHLSNVISPLKTYEYSHFSPHFLPHCGTILC
jgi:hypothetical protein